MGTPPCDKLSFGGPMARAGWVAEVGNLYPFCSQYYAQNYFQKQFFIIPTLEKVIFHAKVVRGLGLIFFCPVSLFFPNPRESFFPVV